jgi:ribosome recycling factor
MIMHVRNIQEMRQHMDKTLKICEEELARLRIGRANPAMVEDVAIDYYGTHTPLKHLAQITAPDANLIVVRPFDGSQLHTVERAIQEANLGFNPVVDKDTLRIAVPKLSQERRQEMVHQLKAKGEESKVALRNNRRHLKEELERQEEAGELSEDDLHRSLREMDKITNEYMVKIDGLIKDKEKQLMTV